MHATWQQVQPPHRDGSKFCEPLRRANGLQAYTCTISTEKYWKGIPYINPSSPPPVRGVMAEGAGFSRLEGTHLLAGPAVSAPSRAQNRAHSPQLLLRCTQAMTLFLSELKYKSHSLLWSLNSTH